MYKFLFNFADFRVGGGNVFDQMARYVIQIEQEAEESYSSTLMEKMDFLTENLQDLIDIVTIADLEGKRDKLVSVWQRQQRVSRDDSDFVAITNITRSLVALTLKCLYVSP